MKVKRWEFRQHGAVKVSATKYINRMGNITVGLPESYTTKAHGKWRPVYQTA